MSYKYLKISSAIKTKIQNGIYPPQEPLPPENTLTEEYQVSRITIRNAIASLVEEGYVTPIPGKGNYVLAKRNDRFLCSLSIDNIFKKQYNKVELLGSQIDHPNIDLVYHLRVSPDSRIVSIRWRLFHNDVPIAYDTQFIPYFPGITLWDNDDYNYTNFNELVSLRNPCFTFDNRLTISAINSDEVVSNKLDIACGTPVMTLTEIISEDENPLGMRLLYIRREWCILHGISSFT
ncbi:MAG: GntR family transcriptional regulator [Eubacterium sp.]